MVEAFTDISTGTGLDNIRINGVVIGQYFYLSAGKQVRWHKWPCKIVLKADVFKWSVTKNCFHFSHDGM